MHRDGDDASNLTPVSNLFAIIVAARRRRGLRSVILRHVVHIAVQNGSIWTLFRQGRAENRRERWLGSFRHNCRNDH
ncbi:hypothetical protein [Sphingobium yanoikuyae]|uniref:hypothetical protein n=1 Tax=Sphingobium yanoikuyae TaxID=13690 RepID=UPI00138E25A2|nr:hypothetical protein [Sphingobium yanoikuyae]